MGGHSHTARLPVPACHRKPTAGNLTVPMVHGIICEELCRGVVRPGAKAVYLR